MTTITLRGDSFVTIGPTGEFDISAAWDNSDPLYSDSNVAVINVNGIGLIEQGTGFTRFDSHGFATTGTVTSFAAKVPHTAGSSATSIEWSDFTISAKSFEKFFKNGDSAAITDFFFGGDDTINTNPGGSEMFGLDGNDTINGAAGHDVEHGGSGDDVLKGGGGIDYFYGGAGADEQTGGSGADTFFYALTTESRKGHVDTIHDLNDIDIIELSAIDANTNLTNKQDFVLVGSFSHTAGELTVVFKAAQNRTIISGDTDGNGKGDLVIYVDGNHADYTNFLLHL